MSTWVGDCAGEKIAGFFPLARAGRRQAALPPMLAPSEVERIT